VQATSKLAVTEVKRVKKNVNWIELRQEKEEWTVTVQYGTIIHGSQQPSDVQAADLGADDHEAAQ
jgi:hypothetical protein